MENKDRIKMLQELKEVQDEMKRRTLPEEGVDAPTVWKEVTKIRDGKEVKEQVEFAIIDGEEIPLTPVEDLKKAEVILQDFYDRSFQKEDLRKLIALYGDHHIGQEMIKELGELTEAAIVRDPYKVLHILKAEIKSIKQSIKDLVKVKYGSTEVGRILILSEKRLLSYKSFLESCAEGMRNIIKFKKEEESKDENSSD